MAYSCMTRECEKFYPLHTTKSLRIGHIRAVLLRCSPGLAWIYTKCVDEDLGHANAGAPKFVATAFYFGFRF